MYSLSHDQLKQLILTVFAPTSDDRALTLISDVPTQLSRDHDAWRERRILTQSWHRQLGELKNDLGLTDVRLYYYPAVGKANADLPSQFFRWNGDAATASEETIATGDAIALEEMLAETDIIIAPTEYSATAPLKIAAKRLNFRGTTMPEFSPSMIPALGIDYERVDEIIQQFKRRLDSAHAADIDFEVEGIAHHLHVDLRFRTATASSGILRTRGIVGNLPSGEAYIVPYEGENEPSLTVGEMPVQFGDEVVVYRIEGNRAVSVLTQGEMSAAEDAMIRKEPAYGNIAEIGLGILGRFGMQPAGNLLMDEKLGLHIAFGRSEHFGGIVSPASFRDPKNVVHIDRVYVPSLQPKIIVRSLTLLYAEGEETIMRDNEWTV